MSHESGTPEKSVGEKGRNSSVSSARDEAASELAHALDEAWWARFRAQNRTSVIGYHGESFDNRNDRVERIVTKFHANNVKRARKQAIRSGWTNDQLVSAGLDVVERAE